MRRRVWVVAVAALVATFAIGSLVASAASGRRFGATLNGFEETPSLSVAGTGSFTAEVSRDGTTVAYTLSYSGLTGPAAVAHIHLGMPAIAGGVAVFLCGGEGQDLCPGAGGSVSGEFTADDVVGPAGQGLAAGEFEELLTAMRFGATYVNVHTDAFPAGEIRGQITG